MTNAFFHCCNNSCATRFTRKYALVIPVAFLFFVELHRLMRTMNQGIIIAHIIVAFYEYQFICASTLIQSDAMISVPKLLAEHVVKLR